MGRELNSAMNNINSLLGNHQISSLQDIHHHHHPPHFDPTSSHDEFLEQMLSSVPSSTSSFPWSDDNNLDENTLLASKMRQHQMSKAALMLQHQQMMLSRNLSATNLIQNDVVDGGASFNSNNMVSDKALFNGFTGSLGQTSSQPQHFGQPQEGQLPAMNQNQPAASGSSAGGAAAAQPRQRVRARRGQATDPHSIAERLRRERIAERMKALQELVPNANKTDKASMLDEIIDYVKFLQLQVKVLSMSRLGGAGGVPPLVGDRSAEARNGNGTLVASSSNTTNDGGMMVAENQVAKLMEEDMGSAMQYLQGKGLCLMPISLATAISSATCHSSRNPLLNAEVGGPTSPSLSALTVQSATVGINGSMEPSVKEGPL